jgi:hypothetical protein
MMLGVLRFMVCSWAVVRVERREELMHLPCQAGGDVIPEGWRCEMSGFPDRTS